MILPTTIEPSTPEFSAIWPNGDSKALSTMLIPACTSGFSSWMRPTAFLARSKATPPPATIPSSTAARVALSASFTRSFFSFSPSARGRPPRRHPAPPPGGCARPLLELFLVVVRVGFLYLLLDLLSPPLDVRFVAGAVHDGGLFLLDDHLLGTSEHGSRDL